MITVSYTAFGLYNTITDSLGRVITFNDGAYYDLQTIIQSWDNITKTLVTFSYDNNFQLFPAFSGLTLKSGHFLRPGRDGLKIARRFSAGKWVKAILVP